MCGADIDPAPSQAVKEGSPPRVRSRLEDAAATLVWGGITSACAEQTLFTSGEQNNTRDHLRVCGAD